MAAIPNSEILAQQTFNANRGVPESLVTASLYLPRTVDPDLVLHISREIAISCPYTHLGRHVSVDIEDTDPRRSSLKLIIQAYVYDHRHETEMQTDILRRAQREFKAYGVLSADDHHR